MAMIRILILMSLSFPALAECPLFGTLDRAENLRCLVAEYQGYADKFARHEAVVLDPKGVRKACSAFGAPFAPGCVIYAGSGCVLVLPAPWGFDDLWAAESACERGLGQRSKQIKTMRVELKETDVFEWFHSHERAR